MFPVAANVSKKVAAVALVLAWTCRSVPVGYDHHSVALIDNLASSTPTWEWTDASRLFNDDYIGTMNAELMALDDGREWPQSVEKKREAWE